jgi:hypothetical protein
VALCRAKKDRVLWWKQPHEPGVSKAAAQAREDRARVITSAMSETVQQLLERVASWPPEDIEKLEQAIGAIEAWRAGGCYPTDDEPREIDAGLAELDRGARGLKTTLIDEATEAPGARHRRRQPRRGTWSGFWPTAAGVRGAIADELERTSSRPIEQIARLPESAPDCVPIREAKSELPIFR